METVPVKTMLREKVPVEMGADLGAVRRGLGAPVASLSILVVGVVMQRRFKPGRNERDARW